MATLDYIELPAVDLTETTLAIITESGVAIVSPPDDCPGGRRFHFADPSGNILGIYQTTPPS